MQSNVTRLLTSTELFWFLPDDKLYEKIVSDANCVTLLYSELKVAHKSLAK